MKKTTLLLIAVFITLSAFTVYNYQCVNLPASLYNYANIPFPTDVINNLPDMDNMPSTNITTDAGATLGRVLFYDVDLSRNHTISCSSCHKQQFSFADSAKFSVGWNGGHTKRNSMGLVHVRFHRDGAMFWDLRAATLEDQVLMPIQDSVEMGLTLDTLVSRVSAKSFYPSLFQAAFGSTDVTAQKISFALAQFVRSINTFNSKYRIGVNTTNGNPSTTPFANFTAQENLGKNLFMDVNRGNCQSCHTRNVFVPQGAQNIGLDLNYVDNGVGQATGQPNKNGKFKVPSLINIAYTAPYMHDGRYKTLMQVINFYSDSIKPHVNLSHFLIDSTTGLPRKPHYTLTEKRALVAFLKTLTDQTVLSTKWKNPFCVTSNRIELDPVLSFNLQRNPIAANEIPMINILGSKDYAVTVNIYSLDGRKIYQKNFEITDGTNSVQLTDAKLPEGIFIVQLASGSETVSTQKLVVTL